MASKRIAGRRAHRLAVKVFRSSRRKSKYALRKLYSAKVGKSKFNQLTGRFKRRRSKRGYGRKRRSFRRSFRRRRY